LYCTLDFWDLSCIRSIFFTYSTSSCTREASCRDTLWQLSQTAVRRSLVRSERDDNVTSNSESVIEIEVAARLGSNTIDGDVGHIGSRPSRNGLVDRRWVEVERCDRCADVQVRIMNRVLGCEWRQN